MHFIFLKDITSFDKLHDVVDTVDDVLLLHTQHRLPDHGLMAVLNDVCQLSSPQHPESLLHLGEYKLDRVVFWVLGDIEYKAEP